jgi:hypothetical protein
VADATPGRGKPHFAWDPLPAGTLSFTVEETQDAAGWGAARDPLPVPTSWAVVPVRWAGPGGEVRVTRVRVPLGPDGQPLPGPRWDVP